MGLERKEGKKKSHALKFWQLSNISVRLKVWGTGTLVAPRSQSQSWRNVGVRPPLQVPGYLGTYLQGSTVARTLSP